MEVETSHPLIEDILSNWRRRNMKSEKFEQATDSTPTLPFMPVLDGRPQRDAAISPDDIINLQIALNTCKSLEEFLEDV